MAISSESQYAQREAAISTAHNGPSPETEAGMGRKINGQADGHATPIQSLSMVHPKTSIDTSGSSVNAHSIETTVDFVGDVVTNNEIPTQEVLRSMEDMTLLDKDGKFIPFKNLYYGPNVTRRVLVIFIRHFFCGVCFFSSLVIIDTLIFPRTAKNTSEPSLIIRKAERDTELVN